MFHAPRADALNRIGEWERALADARIAPGSAVEKGAGLRGGRRGLARAGEQRQRLFLLRSRCRSRTIPEAFYQLALVRLRPVIGPRRWTIGTGLRLRPSLVGAARTGNPQDAARGHGRRHGGPGTFRGARSEGPVNWNSQGYGHATLRAIISGPSRIATRPSKLELLLFNNRGYSRLKLGDRRP